MKKVLLISGVIVVALLTWILYNKYRVVIPPVDIGKSEIGWSAKSVSDTHFGKVRLNKAVLEIQDGKLVGGSFEADMTSITVDDISDAEHNADFIRHISDGDFFETNRYPTASFRITESSQVSSGLYVVKGEMTIKGVTKPIEFQVQLKAAGEALVASGIVTVNKQNFGIEYGGQGKPGSEKDWFIYDDFTLNVNVVSPR